MEFQVQAYAIFCICTDQLPRLLQALEQGLPV